MTKRSLLILFLLICSIVIYAQNWTNLSYNPDQPGIENNPFKGFMTLWNSGNNFPRSIQGHNFGLNEVMKGMNSFDWSVIDNTLNKDVAIGDFAEIQVIIDPANGTTKMPGFLINQVDWKVKPGSLCPDWNNEILMQAMLNFIAAFGKKYNEDDRIFSITLGLYGMWGEWHVGSDKTYEMTVANKTRIANAYTKAFPDVNLKARYANAVPDPQIYGYSDGLFFEQSLNPNPDNPWAFHNMLKLNHADQNWKQHIIGGEISPELQGDIWKSWPNAVGQDVQQCMDSIRPTYLISHYVLTKVQPNTQEWENAIRAQKMMGYTFFVSQYRLTADGGKPTVEVEIQNKGLAPLYANWDIEIGVLNSGNGFQSLGKTKWNLKSILPDIKDHYRAITASTAIGDGTYTVLLRIVNPLEKYSTKAKPLRFANSTQDDHKEGWVTIGEMTITEGICGVPPTHVSGIAITPSVIRLPVGDTLRLSANVLPVDATRKDLSWISDHPATVSVDSTGLVSVGILGGQATITAITQDGGFVAKSIIHVGEINQKTWVFPGDTALAWQYKYYPWLSGDTLFAQDSAQTIGIYSCNNTTGVNIRSYTDAGKFKDAAQFKWNNETETFQINGQWADYMVKFTETAPYQLLVRARNNVDANFKLTIYKSSGDTILFNNLNLINDFTNLGGGNEQTDWFISKIPLSNLMPANTLRFDWYDNVAEPGIFGGFTLIKSELDLTPPEWYYVSAGVIERGTDIVVMTTEKATVYLVPAGTTPDTTSIKVAALAITEITAYKQAKLATSGLNTGDYMVYAIDVSGNISMASKVINLQLPVIVFEIPYVLQIKVLYKNASQVIKVESTEELNRINVYNILGIKVGSKNCEGKSCNYQTNGMFAGVYLVQVYDKGGNSVTKKVFIK